MAYRANGGQFRQVLCWQATKATKAVVLPPKDTTQRCRCCGTKAKPRMELSDRVYRCRACGLVLGRGRNSAPEPEPGSHWGIGGQVRTRRCCSPGGRRQEAHGPCGGPGGLSPRIQRLQSWEQSSRGLVMPSRCDAVTL
ncbi:MAG: zinc ribbon domain-containing protein [Acidimicrobiales bacterium]